MNKKLTFVYVVQTRNLECGIISLSRSNLEKNKK